jgi:hypothetical protein
LKLVDHGGHAVLVLFWKSFEIRRFHDCCPFLILLLPPCSPAYSERKTPKLNKPSDVTHATAKERKNETEAAHKTLNTRPEEKP